MKGVICAECKHMYLRSKTYIERELCGKSKEDRNYVTGESLGHQLCKHMNKWGTCRKFEEKEGDS